MQQFTHLDNDGKPAMVDVGSKSLTWREATAQAILALPPEVSVHFEQGDANTKKGPVIHTAILAGTMGVKKTSDLIPLCHPLAIEKCRFDSEMMADGKLLIRCTVGITGKTGVEMEALTGVSVAALTVYDMCKAFSHDIVIQEIRLLYKTGGKNDFTHTSHA
jgi:cyclic pyranopterin monophosphate synthase